MPLRIQCIHCQSTINVSETLRGKSIRCPHCQESTRVPGGQSPKTTQMGQAPQGRSTRMEGTDPRIAKRTHLGQPERKSTSLGRSQRRQEDEVRVADERIGAGRGRERDRFDGGPRRPRGSKGSRALLWVGVGVGALAVLATVGWFVVVPLFKDKPPVAVHDGKADEAKEALFPAEEKIYAMLKTEFGKQYNMKKFSSEKKQEIDLLEQKLAKKLAPRNKALTASQKTAVIRELDDAGHYLALCRQIEHQDFEAKQTEALDILFNKATGKAAARKKTGDQARNPIPDKLALNTPDKTKVPPDDPQPPPDKTKVKDPPPDVVKNPPPPPPDKTKVKDPPPDLVKNPPPPPPDKTKVKDPPTDVVKNPPPPPPPPDKTKVKDPPPDVVKNPPPDKTPVKDPPPDKTAFQPTPVPPGPAPASIIPEVTKRVKKATVYIEVTDSKGSRGSGSGFLAMEPGVVITNAHVVGMLQANAKLPKKVEVVLNSGIKADERKFEGIVLGADRESDLALIRLKGVDTSTLPPMLPVELDGCSLTELQAVYIFGFPHGAELGKEITASASSVSSFRRDVDGSLYQIQVNGGMHPGNSGGPVVDTRGVVVGVAVAGIPGTQLNFAVPSEKIQGMLHGRVQETKLGEAYLQDKAIKLPLKITCLDPLQRVREVKVDVWSGPGGAPRPNSLKAPADLPGDSQKQAITLSYLQGTGSCDLVLPTLNLPEGHVYWIQPRLTTRAGVQQWAVSTTVKPADIAPLTRTAASMSFNTATSLRSLDMAGKIEIQVSNGKKKEIESDDLKFQVLEEMTKADKGSSLRVAMGKGGFSTTERGKTVPRQANAQNLVKRRIFAYATDPTGRLEKFTFPQFMPPSPPPYRGKGKRPPSPPPISIERQIMFLEAEDMASMFNTTYQLSNLSVPNRTVQPLEVWDARIAILIGSARRRTTLDLFMKYTYEGTRTVNGKTEAVITIVGQVEKREKTKSPLASSRPKSRIVGRGNFDVAGGYFSKLKVALVNEGEFDGLSVSQTLEVALTRVPGNIYNIGPLPPPGGSAPPPPVVAGKVILDRKDSLTSTDPPNPKQKGTHQKTFEVNLTSGTLYVIDLKKDAGSSLDTYLILQDPAGKTITEDDDGGGNFNARIVHKAATTGSHRIIATSYKPGETGKFILTVAEAKPALPPNRKPDTRVTMQPHSPGKPLPKDGTWEVLFRSNDPAIWNSEVVNGSFIAGKLNRASPGIKYLRLKRMDTGEMLIMPITYAQLNRDPLYGPVTSDWCGSNRFSWEGRHLGIAQVPRLNESANKGMICILEAGGEGAFSGSGFGHVAYENNKGQGYSWKGKPIAGTVFEISVTKSDLSTAEKAVLVEVPTQIAIDPATIIPLPPRPAGVAGKVTVDLIALLDPTRDSLHGRWVKAGNALKCEDQHLRPRVQVPYRPPVEYDYTVTFSQLRPRNGVSFIMPNPNGKSFIYTIGGGLGADHGLHPLVRGKNRPQLARPVQPNTTYTVTVQVRREGITVLQDGKEILRHSNYRDLVTDEIQMNSPILLGLACDDPTIFYYVQVVEITGIGVKTGPSSSTGRDDAVYAVSSQFFDNIKQTINTKSATVADEGGSRRGEVFQEVPPDGGILIGFQLNSGRTVEGVRAIYLTKNGEVLGNWHGRAVANPKIVKAKPGYVVGGVTVRCGLGMDSMSVKFFRLDKDRVRVDDAYDSSKYGGNGGGATYIVGMSGDCFVGICGHDANGLTAIGFMKLE